MQRAAPDGPAGPSTAQQVHGVTTNHGSVILAGGNVIQTNDNGHPQPSISIKTVLRLVPNIRQIHLDVFSKATPRTAIWILRTEHFLLWLDPDGDLKILWGTGIREFLLRSVWIKLRPPSSRRWQERYGFSR